MYESPIKIYETKSEFNVAEETDKLVMTEVHKVGITVDKDELIRALQYDRDQYDKGYNDAKKAMEKYKWHDLRKSPEDKPEYDVRSKEEIEEDTNSFREEAIHEGSDPDEYIKARLIIGRTTHKILGIDYKGMVDYDYADIYADGDVYMEWIGVLKAWRELDVFEED